LIGARRESCVNIVPGIRSIYRWQGKICKDGELMLVVKTLATEFDGLAAAIRELHSYEVPEILAFEVSRGEQRFLDWIAGSVDKEAEFSDEQVDELAYAGDPDDADF
jgi:periplasmic divalent cation tolerance protein